MTPREEIDRTAVSRESPWAEIQRPVPVPLHRQPNAPAWMQIPAFRDLPEAAILRLQSVMAPRVYASGDVLMRQGDPGDGFLILESGQVRVVVCNDAGAPVFEREMGAPAVLGEAAVLTGERRTASANTLVR